jgi:uncharacterized glyoxalase superfamily protein PhnB
MVKPIPEGYRTVTPFMNIKGCLEAIELYKKALGAEERGVMKAPDGTVMHAELKIGDSIVMFGEAAMNPATKSSLHLYVPDCDAAFKRAVDAGMKVEAPMADMFWGDRYGVVEDKFGNRWAFGTHKEDVSHDEMMKRAQAFMASQKK